MPTTLSTGHVNLEGENRYRPKIVRAVASVATTITSTNLGSIIDTHKYAIARATMHAAAIAANTTLTISVLTGPSTAAVAQEAQTSTGGLSIDLSTTDAITRVFVGLDRFTRVKWVGANGAANSTGIFVDLELV